MTIEDAIHSLSESGLNIFLSIKVSKIPPEIFVFSKSQQSKTLVILGSGGKTLWKNLDLSTKDPIDSFSIESIKKLENIFSKNKIEILYPNQSIQIPLQKLGRFLNLSHQSPLGIDISRDFGLWFSFRVAFLTESEIPEHIPEKKISHCEECTQRPCLSVESFYNARMKCPVQNQHQYTNEQQDYHQSIVEKLINN